MTTFMSLFSGGGGADIGAMMAGMTPVAAVEYDADIADVYRHNLGDHVTVADICALAPADFPAVDVLHASPPCPNFSTAKAGAKETPQDIALADAVIRFVTTLRPRAFTLENVIGYRKSESYRRILGALHEAGYWTAVHKINFADYGVPQTRRRLIVRAVRGGWVPTLQPTHAGRWVGWYDAIEDLIPTLPDCDLANWQRERLPAGLGRVVLVGNNANKTSGAQIYRQAGEPAFTLRAYSGGRRLRIAKPCGGAVEVTPHGEARFQTFPDWYELPAAQTLAGTVNGNAVPPLGYAAMVRGLG